MLADRAPFVELPIRTTEDRLVGSIDLAAALTGGEARFLAGLQAAPGGRRVPGQQWDASDSGPELSHHLRSCR